MIYDSTAETQAHIAEVQELLEEVIGGLRYRSAVHDRSKLEEPEKAMYDEFTPKLRELTYGSDEYKQCLADMGPALAHHYIANSHHPEHWPDGIRGMSLLDVVEMLVDWAAAVKRHDDGDLRRSITLNQSRFGYSTDLAEILLNTANELGW